ncbi:MAG: DUF1338 domain-containing protein [Mastigocoleus sp.]
MNPKQVYQLWDILWQQYRNRVSYARLYEQMITAAGGKVANDHIALRSLRLHTQVPPDNQTQTQNNPQVINFGIEYLEKITQLLGYQIGGEYTFPQKHLYARHYYHPQQKEYNLPKLFISELIVDELPQDIRNAIAQTITRGNLHTIINRSISIPEDIIQLSHIFHRPWNPPKYSIVKQVNQVTQYGAWVLMHGYAVNHFTGYVNQQNTSQYPDIDTTAKALAQLDIPMKEKIEGCVEVGLRQTATRAVTEMITVLDDIKTLQEIKIPWTYAYYEIAQRYLIEQSGEKVLFEKFLGENATELFEMTNLSHN